MSVSSNRRQFLSTAAAAGAFAGLSQLEFLGKLPRVSAEEAKPDPKIVRLSDDIEPLVRVLEETPREKLLEEVAAPHSPGDDLSRGRRGAAAGRRAERAAAAQRGLQVSCGAGGELGPPGEHSARPTSTAGCRSFGPSTSSSRARPLTSARGTGRCRRSTRPACRRRTRPGPCSPRRWTTGTKRRPMWRSPPWPAPRGRTSCSICLPATAAAISARSVTRRFMSPTPGGRLNCVGWQYAEPVLRSLAYALLNHERQTDPHQNDYEADRPGRENLARAKKLREDWQARQDRRRRDPRAAGHDLQRHGQRALRPGRRNDQPRHQPAIGVGRPVRRQRRAA